MEDSAKSKKKIGNTIVCAALAGALAGTIGLIIYGSKNSNNLSRYLNNKTKEKLSIDRRLDRLYSNYTASLAFIEKYKDEIIESANKYNVPVDLIAATVYSENCARKRIEDLKDVVGKYLGLDVSLGAGQVNTSTAAFLDGLVENSKEFKGLDKKTKKSLKKKLETPEENIEYIAKYLSFLINRKNRFKGMSFEEIMSNPQYLGVIGTEYVLGPSEKPIDKFGISPEGYSFLGLLSTNDFSRVLGGASVMDFTERGNISEYLKQNKQEIYKRTK